MAFLVVVDRGSAPFGPRVAAAVSAASGGARVSWLAAHRPPAAGANPSPFRLADDAGGPPPPALEMRPEDGAPADWPALWNAVARHAAAEIGGCGDLVVHVLLLLHPLALPDPPQLALLPLAPKEGPVRWPPEDGGVKREDGGDSAGNWNRSWNWNPLSAADANSAGERLDRRVANPAPDSEEDVDGASAAKRSRRKRARPSSPWDAFAAALDAGGRGGGPRLVPHVLAVGSGDDLAALRDSMSAHCRAAAAAWGTFATVRADADGSALAAAAHALVRGIVGGAEPLRLCVGHLSSLVRVLPPLALADRLAAVLLALSSRGAPLRLPGTLSVVALAPLRAYVGAAVLSRHVLLPPAREPVDEPPLAPPGPLLGAADDGRAPFDPRALAPARHVLSVLRRTLLDVDAFGDVGALVQFGVPSECCFGLLRVLRPGPTASAAAAYGHPDSAAVLTLDLLDPSVPLPAGVAQPPLSRTPLHWMLAPPAPCETGDALLRAPLPRLAQLPSFSDGAIALLLDRVRDLAGRLPGSAIQLHCERHAVRYMADAFDRPDVIAELDGILLHFQAPTGSDAAEDVH
jgi:hypothetical protein